MRRGRGNESRIPHQAPIWYPHSEQDIDRSKMLQSNTLTLVAALSRAFVLAKGLLDGTLRGLF
jgi:hypothetical protein